MPDPVTAVKDYLLADAGVSAQVGTRVFAGELPRSEVESMPRRAIVVRPAGGGLLGRAYQRYGDTRIDMSCYGATPHEAWALYRVARSALKHLRRAVVGDTLLHWARVSSDGTTLRDADTDWPVTLASWQVLGAETAAT